MGEHTDAYAWGRFPTPPDSPWLEPLTILAACATATERIRLATGIVIAPLRPAALLAKQAATLDVLSRGRLDLGVGTGWQREEYEAEGLDFERRAVLLTDTLAAMRALWRDTPADFAGQTLSFERIYCMPKPVQEGGVPLWVAGTLSRRNLERVVRFASGWIPIMGETAEGIAAGLVTIRDAFRTAGRDASGLRVQAPVRVARGADGEPSIERTMESVPDLVAAGVTDVNVPLAAFCRDPEQATDVLRRVVTAFRGVA
ncbi:MAG: LLM class F420-dependent oxidoreductase [Acidimicrobiia bacterium]|nr:MAG: LLM class F420-dependent oxidoreductase [Acidimicrobiia bacterium]